MALTTLLGQPLRVVNLGLEIFAEELTRDGITVLQVDWRPPAVSSDVAALLARLEDD